MDQIPSVALDAILEGNEPVVQSIAAEEGPAVADAYVSTFNNACCQMTGFEVPMREASCSSTRFVPTLYGLSRMEH